MKTTYKKSTWWNIQNINTHCNSLLNNIKIIQVPGLEKVGNPKTLKAKAYMQNF